MAVGSKSQFALLIDELYNDLIGEDQPKKRTLLSLQSYKKGRRILSIEVNERIGKSEYFYSLPDVNLNNTWFLVNMSPAGEERILDSGKEEGGTTNKATEFELCLALTTPKYDWLVLGALTTSRRVNIQDTCDVLRERLSRFNTKIESFRIAARRP